MKQPVLLFFAFGALLSACKKTSEPLPSNTQKPAVEFVRFNVSTNNTDTQEFFLEKPKSGGHQHCHVSQSGSINWSMSNSGEEGVGEHIPFIWTHCTLATTSHSADTFDLTETGKNAVNITITLDNGEIIHMSNFSGRVIIEHFPEGISDYVVGTFNGVFTTGVMTSDTFYVSNGAFRMMQLSSD